MSRLKHNCFPPLSRVDAQTLILGSLPGAMSLARGQYYAHPQNAFWRIMGRLFDFSPIDCSYEDKVQIVLRHRIAVWDVCAAAHRVGSLDAAIENVVPNNFADFYLAHPKIKLVCFNGAKAEAVYQQKVLPLLHGNGFNLRYHRLPSTSPAHAGMTFEKKLAAWSKLLGLDANLDQAAH